MTRTSKIGLGAFAFALLASILILAGWDVGGFSWGAPRPLLVSLRDSGVAFIIGLLLFWAVTSPDDRPKGQREPGTDTVLKALGFSGLMFLARWAGSNGRAQPAGPPRPIVEALADGAFVFVVALPLFWVEAWLRKRESSKAGKHPEGAGRG